MSKPIQFAFILILFVGGGALLHAYHVRCVKQAAREAAARAPSLAPSTAAIAQEPTPVDARSQPAVADSAASRPPAETPVEPTVSAPLRRVAHLGESHPHGNGQVQGPEPGINQSGHSEEVLESKPPLHDPFLVQPLL